MRDELTWTYGGEIRVKSVKKDEHKCRLRTGW